MEKNNSSEGMREARIEFDGDLAYWVREIKKVRGVKNNAELLRILIAEEYDRLVTRGRIQVEVAAQAGR